MLRALVLALVATTLGACRVKGTFVCERSEQCRQGGDVGTCEATGFCSFDDPMCPSGHRYDDTAGNGYADECVAGPDAGSVDAALGAWGTPTLVFTSTGDDDPTLTADMLELYFNRGDNVYVTSRTAPSEAWVTPAVVPVVSSGDNEDTPELTGDGLTMFFARDGQGAGLDIYVTTRASRLQPWGNVTRIPELVSGGIDGAAAPTGDLLRLVFVSSRQNGLDLYETTRTSSSAPWGTPAPLAELNTPQDESNGFFTADGLEIYFSSARAGNRDLYVARRPTRDAAFSAPEPITELNTAQHDDDPWLSPDRRHLFFVSDRSGATAIYEATR